jgi:hypothetical protein
MYTQGERNKSKTSEPVETGKSWAGYIYSPNLKMLLHFFFFSFSIDDQVEVN